jgi:hypothetical protein
VRCSLLDKQKRLSASRGHALDESSRQQSPWLHDALLSSFAGMIGTLRDIRFWLCLARLKD